MFLNFSVTAATSDLRDDPAVTVNYHYFTDKFGEVARMLPLQRPGLVWIEETFTPIYTKNHGLHTWFQLW